MENTSCRNCGGVIASHHQFCPHCGQKTALPRLTIRQLAIEFVQTFVHAEKGIVRLMRGLLLHPGKTAAEYVEGKRKTYFNPFAFLAICITVMLLLNTWIKPYGDLPTPDPEVMARMPREELKWMYEDTVHRLAAAQDLMNKNLNLFSVLVTPYFSFFLWLFFKSRNRNMAEITVAYLLFTACSNLVTAIIFSPFLAMMGNSPGYYYLLGGIILTQTFYFAWGFKTFFNYRTTGNYFRVLLVLWLIGFVGFIIFMGAYFIYVYRGAYEVLPYLSS